MQREHKKQNAVKMSGFRDGIFNMPNNVNHRQGTIHVHALWKFVVRCKVGCLLGRGSGPLAARSVTL